MQLRQPLFSEPTKQLIDSGVGVCMQVHIYFAPWPTEERMQRDAELEREREKIWREREGEVWREREREEERGREERER